MQEQSTRPFFLKRTDYRRKRASFRCGAGRLSEKCSIRHSGESFSFTDAYRAAASQPSVQLPQLRAATVFDRCPDRPSAGAGRSPICLEWLTPAERPVAMGEQLLLSVGMKARSYPLGLFDFQCIDGLNHSFLLDRPSPGRRAGDSHEVGPFWASWRIGGSGQKRVPASRGGPLKQHLVML